MSTKIYDGLRLADPAASLFDVVETVRAAIVDNFKIARRAIVTRSWAELVDQGPYGADHEMAFFDAEELWRKRQDEFGRHHTLNDPLRFSIVFGRAVSGRVLALPFCTASSGNLDALMSTGLFEEYAYQNNSDQPADVTEEAWDERRRDWDSVMNSEGSFNHLPMWQLSSLDETFTFDILLEPEFDLDALVDPRQRLERALHKTLTESRGTLDRSTIMSVLSADARVARAFVKSLPEDSPHLPAPLPALASKYRDLPGPLVIDDALAQLARDFTEAE